MGRRAMMIRRRRSGIPRTLRISRQMLPQRVRVKLPWYITLNLSTEAAALQYAEATLSLNNLLDPGAGFSTRQPAAFGQWIGMYSGYLVRGVSYSVTVRPNTNVDSADTCMNGYAGVISGDSIYTTFPGNISEAMEMTPEMGRKVRRWTAPSSTNRDTATQWGPCILKGFVNLRRLARKSQQLVQWPNEYWGSSGAGPTAELNQTIWAGTTPQGSGTSGAPETNHLPYIVCEVKYVFYTEFANPNGWVV